MIIRQLQRYIEHDRRQRDVCHTFEMGHMLSVILSRLFNKKHLRMLMIGLDAAGKTTILYKMKFGEIVSTIPTIGFNVETLEYKNVCFTVWDVGGQSKIRPLWRHYFHNTDGVIFVVDSNDRDRVDEARRELHSIFREGELKDAVLLILANKQDLPEVMSTNELKDRLQLNRLRNSWHIQSTCATKGADIRDGFDWLLSELSRK